MEANVKPIQERNDDKAQTNTDFFVEWQFAEARLIPAPLPEIQKSQLVVRDLSRATESPSKKG